MAIEGEIIRLRAVEPEDIDTMYRWENDPAIWPVSGTTEPFSREQMQRFVERQLGGGDLLHTGQLRLMIEALPGRGDAGSVKAAAVGGAGSAEGCTAERDSDTPRAVGAVDLFDYDPLNRRAGVGILIYANDDRRRGYASDALKVLCRYLRDTLGLHQLWCDIGADNRASLQLFRRAGFTEIGVKRQWLWRPDGYRDEVMMQKILK